MYGKCSGLFDSPSIEKQVNGTVVVVHLSKSTAFQESRWKWWADIFALCVIFSSFVILSKTQNLRKLLAKTLLRYIVREVCFDFTWSNVCTNNEIKREVIGKWVWSSKSQKSMGSKNPNKPTSPRTFAFQGTLPCVRKFGRVQTSRNCTCREVGSLRKSVTGRGTDIQRRQSLQERIFLSSWFLWKVIAIVDT